MKLKKCLECGKEFYPKNGFQKYCNGPHTAVCVICNKEFQYTCRPSEKPKTCSRSCQTELQHRTSKELYGVDNVSQIPGVYDKKDEVKASKKKVRICKWCGKEFVGYGTAAYCDGPHYATCEVCGKEFEINPRQPKRACSQKCKQILIQRDLATQVRICEECGKEFHPTSSMSRYCAGPHYKPCVICGTMIEYQPGSAANAVNCCSTKCSNELRRRTSNELHGYDFPSQRPEAREAARQKAIENAEDRMDTCLTTYGYDNVAKVPEFKEKISNTVASEDCQTRTKNTTYARFGVWHAAQSLEVQQNRRNNRNIHLADDGTSTDSSYEQMVYNFCLRHKLNFKYQPISMPYYVEGNVHYTIVDFEIEGRLFEVKGGHFIKGLFKEEQHIEEKMLAYAKNQVIIITDSEAKETLIEYEPEISNTLIGIDIDLFKKSIDIQNIWEIIAYCISKRYKFIDDFLIDDLKQQGLINILSIKNSTPIKPVVTPKSNHTWINQNGVEQCIDNQYLQYWLDGGWSLGRNSKDNSGRKLMHKGNEQILVDSSEVEVYESRGWVLGSAKEAHNKGMTTVVDSSGKHKHVTKEEAQNLIASGKYSKGNNATGTVHIYHPDTKETKMVKRDVLQSYLDQGWVKGRPKAYTKGKIWVYNETLRKNKRIDPEDVDKFLADGWLKGKKSFK